MIVFGAWLLRKKNKRIPYVHAVLYTMLCCDYYWDTYDDDESSETDRLKKYFIDFDYSV